MHDGSMIITVYTYVHTYIQNMDMSRVDGKDRSRSFYLFHEFSKTLYGDSMECNKKLLRCQNLQP